MVDITTEIEGTLTDRSFKFFDLLQPSSGVTFEQFVTAGIDGLTRNEWRFDRTSDKRFKLSRDTVTYSPFTYEYVQDYIDVFTERFATVNELGFVKVDTITIWSNGEKFSHVFGPGHIFFRLQN